MGIFDKIIHPKKTPPVPQVRHRQGIEAKQFLLEGTRFPIFTQEAEFIDECRRTGSAAMALPFADFWPVYRRCSEAGVVKNATRLFCASCLAEMPMGFKLNLPDGMTDGKAETAPAEPEPVAEGISLLPQPPVDELLAPEELPAPGESTRCPFCDKEQALFLDDNAVYEDLSENDLQLLRDLWRYRAQLWWRISTSLTAYCNDPSCSTELRRGEGYHLGDGLYCDRYVRSVTSPAALDEMKREADYWGVAELRRARNFYAGLWHFEQSSLVNTGESPEIHKEQAVNMEHYH